MSKTIDWSLYLSPDATPTFQQQASLERDHIPVYRHHANTGLGTGRGTGTNAATSGIGRAPHSTDAAAIYKWTART